MELRIMNSFGKLFVTHSLALFFCLSFVSPAYADRVYMIQGARGAITFTTRKPSSGEKYKPVRLREPTYSTIIRDRGRLARIKKSEYDSLIVSVAEHYELEPALVKAVVLAESSFNPLATSNKGAMGLMQLMPATASRFGVEDAYHPEENIRAGVRYLKMLYDRYEGDIHLALAAYNAGEGAVDRLRAIPPYPETQTYVRRVLSYLESYRCVDAGRENCKV
jgi:soluble lytic murein transglycosylase-like protein